MSPTRLSRRSFAALSMGTLGAFRAGAAVAAAPPSDADADALHVLGRLGFGPAPGELRRVGRIGVERYIDEQLDPERLPLPAALTAQLDALATTRLSQRELAARFREAAEAARNGGDDGQAQRRELYRRIAFEAGTARLLRAIRSPRQLHEVMVDFWFNRFNVHIAKGLDRVLVENYEREAIRPHAMGRFRDLLGATAHHPAMLVYLDNWLSAAPGSRPRGAPAAAIPGGLNENYARELMELHTLGADGGYTQQDVTALARMLTGWTVDVRGRAGGASLFVFDARRHDDGDKDWLGQRVAPRGQAEGEWALDVLAAHPATARRVGFALAQYFVADAPPEGLVERLTRRFAATDGDIGAVLGTLFASAEFRAPATRSAKFKTPYRYVVSSLRAADLPLSNVRPLLAALYGLGMPLYGCQTPDGYPNTEAAWLNPDAVTRRIAFATALASGRLPLARPIDDAGAGTEPIRVREMQRVADPPLAAVDPAWTTPPVDVDALLATLGATVSAPTRVAVAASDPRLRAALVLGSPDFMRH